MQLAFVLQGGWLLPRPSQCRASRKDAVKELMQRQLMVRRPCPFRSRHRPLPLRRPLPPRRLLPRWRPPARSRPGRRWCGRACRRRRPRRRPQPQHLRPALRRRRPLRWPEQCGLEMTPKTCSTCGRSSCSSSIRSSSRCSIYTRFSRCRLVSRQVPRMKPRHRPVLGPCFRTRRVLYWRPTLGATCRQPRISYRRLMRRPLRPPRRLTPRQPLSPLPLGAAQGEPVGRRPELSPTARPPASPPRLPRRSGVRLGRRRGRSGSWWRTWSSVSSSIPPPPRRSSVPSSERIWPCAPRWRGCSARTLLCSNNWLT
mmetsp:Transcript_48605/g.137999  ORF Transcript_48605/g.137999 Transcript_48605/m.137999 type:complete len:313 (+) Transcript_48605:713-1651(+)